MNACWTTGWKRLEVTGAIEEALEENTAKFDHFVDTEKTADAINDFCKKKVTNAQRPLLAKIPTKQWRDERRSTQEEWCDREGGQPRAKAEDKRQTHGNFGRLSISLCLANKRHENDRKWILGEQLNQAVKKGEVREAHRRWRMLAGRGIGARRHLSRILAKRQSLDESVKTLEQPIDKDGCHGLRIIFSDMVERMKDPTPSRTAGKFLFSKRRSTETAQARNWM